MTLVLADSGIIIHLGMITFEALLEPLYREHIRLTPNGTAMVKQCGGGKWNEWQRYSRLQCWTSDNRSLTHMRVPHLPVLLLTASVGAQARFWRILGRHSHIRAASPSREVRRLAVRSPGERGHIHFVVVGAAGFDLQSYRLQRG